MQYIYGIHAVDSLLRQNSKSVQRLLLQAGRNDKRINGLLELAQNQGVVVVREPRAALDKVASGRHQGAVAQVHDSAGTAAHAASNLWDEAELLQAVEALFLRNPLFRA